MGQCYISHLNNFMADKFNLINWLCPWKSLLIPAAFVTALARLSVVGCKCKTWSWMLHVKLQQWSMWWGAVEFGWARLVVLKLRTFTACVGGWCYFRSVATFSHFLFCSFIRMEGHPPKLPFLSHSSMHLPKMSFVSSISPPAALTVLVLSFSVLSIPAMPLLWWLCKPRAPSWPVTSAVQPPPCCSARSCNHCVFSASSSAVCTFLTVRAGCGTHLHPERALLAGGASLQKREPKATVLLK